MVYAEEFDRYIRDSRVATIRDCGIPKVEQPAATLRLVREFLDEDAR